MISIVVRVDQPKSTGMDSPPGYLGVSLQHHNWLPEHPMATERGKQSLANIIVMRRFSGRDGFTVFHPDHVPVATGEFGVASE